MESPTASTDAAMEFSESMDERITEGEAVDEEEGSLQQQSISNNTKCFSIIQTKKFLAPPLLTACRLCPSMDLVILGMQTPVDASSAASLWLHRTVSWQRLATLTEFEDDTTTNSNNDINTDTEKEGVNHVAWSPDGRKFALALPNGNVVLYHVEAMVSSGSSSMTGDAGLQGLLCVVPVSQESILGLTWAHGGRQHPSWNLSEAEQEAEISWGYRTRYIDRAANLLPPSEHHRNHYPAHGSEGVTSNSSALPTCQTPLSLLCVGTKGKGLHIFLHGRYRILTLPMMAQRNVDVVCSSDLSNLLVHQEKSMNLSLFSTPALAQHRYNLQTISSLYCSISSHLEALQKHAPEILASWKVSIKPLDTKLEALVRLLKDYGVDLDMRSVLVQYIVVGHTSVSADLSNAIDQFFTGVQMNDQLVTRMERSLQAAIANVETTARSFLLGPARALAYHAGELLGLARCTSSLLSEEAVQKTHDSCAVLLTTVEYTITQLVEARFRLRDFVAWLRNAGSEVKARGTAPNSAQRENAKKRRVPKATVGRILKYLQTDTYQSTSVTETLLGIPVTELLHDGAKFVHSRPSSPTTVSTSNLMARIMERKTPTVIYAANHTHTAVLEAFEHPREFMSRSVYRLDLFLPVAKKAAFLPVAIHSRVGRGAPKHEEEDFGESEETNNEGFLSPSVLSGKSFPGITHFDCRHWSIIAKTSAPADSKESYAVKLYLIPHGWVDPTEDEEEEDEFGLGIDAEDIIAGCGVPFYLTTEIILPAGGRVLDMGFYGDDGKSNLSSGLDSGTGVERRQALGILLSCQDLPSPEDTIELWMLKYDGLMFQVMQTKKDSKQIFLDDGDIDSQCRVLAHARCSEEDEEEEGFLLAKTRRVGSIDPASAQNTSSRLVLSGPRGIAGVFTTVEGVTTLDLIDIEEDEEIDSEADSQSQSMDD